MQEEKINFETQESAKKSIEKSVSIGALLVNARKAASLSQVDVAEQINLPLRIVKALEADDFDNLPEATYIRGYLRNYARIVGINADLLINTFKEQHHQEPEVITPIRSKQSYDPAILWSTAAVFTILVGLVVTWWFESNPVTTPSVELVSNESTAKTNTEMKQDFKHPLGSKDESAVAEVHDELPVPMIDHQTSEMNNPSVVDVITEDQQQAMEDESRNPNLVSLNDGAQMLTVTYVEKSWTEIRDADANTLMQGLIEPGVVRNLRGKPPFEVFLGNAPGVVIEVNGLYFDHSQYNRSNRTARFQVSSSSPN